MSTQEEFDSVLIIGFGGPTPGCCGRRETCPLRDGEECSSEEARCFVSGILGDNPARLKRVDDVVDHYKHFDGYSPYNALTGQQADALAVNLKERGYDVPVYVCYRHWAPWPKDVLEEMYANGHRKTALLIMAPHQSSVSWDWYIKFAAEGQEAAENAPEFVRIVNPWWKDDGYINAVIAQLEQATETWTEEQHKEAELIFTAHAIPVPLEQSSPYREQIAESASLAAKKFRGENAEYHVAFQSAPDGPGVPWSSPDVMDVVKELHEKGVKSILVQAVGFLVDHTEVQFDLDHELKEYCDELGIAYTRAKCVHAHEAFIAALADRVLEPAG